MEIAVIEQKLVEVVRITREWGGHDDADKIDAKTCPLDLDKFDSKLEPTAIDMLCDLIGVHIPNDVNIFRSSDKRKKLCIREIAVVVQIILSREVK
jgi:hypothetical protein